MVKRAEPYVTADNLAEQTRKWLAQIREVVPRQPQLVLSPAKCGLLVIDALNYFADPEGRAYQPAAAAILPQIGRLLDVWRKNEFKVAFTRHCHEGTHDLGMLGKFFKDFIHEGEPESQIVPSLAPIAGEPVFRKTTYDGFHGTGLDAWLRQCGLSQVLVVGMLTQLCCETTARSAFVHGFEVYVAADATLTSNERLHIGALTGLASGVAVIMTVDEVERICRRHLS